MKLYPALLSVALFTLAGGFLLQNRVAITRQQIDADTALKTGDIIFQSSNGPQAQAIKLATHSPYSHCGLIVRDSTGVYVLEGIQPVSLTPLEDFVSRDENRHYVVKRVRTAVLNLNDSLKDLLASNGQRHLGKNYDLYFNWSDENIYCSELVWKVYKQTTGLEVGDLQKLKDFDLNSPQVKTKLKERYGNNIPLNENVISPSAIYNSDKLETIIEK